MSVHGTRSADRPPQAADFSTPGSQLFRRIDGANMPLDIFKNALINPSFDVWQRGTSFTVNGYGADRWYMYATGGSVTHSRQAFAIGDVPSESQYFARVSTTGLSSASDYCVFFQSIEGVRRFAGKRVVVRGLARRSAGAGNMYVDLTQQLGTGGSGAPIVAGSLVNLSTLWTPFAVYCNVPSLSGQILGTAGTDSLNLNFFLSVGSGGGTARSVLGLQNGITVDLADIEIKEVIPGYGDQVPGFERVPRDLDFLRCHRYYEKSYPLAVAPGTTSERRGSVGFFITGSNMVGGGFYVRHAPKRIIPSVTIYSPQTGAAGYAQDYFTNTDKAMTVDLGSEFGFRVWNNTLPAATGYALECQFIANAEF